MLFDIASGQERVYVSLSVCTCSVPTACAQHVAQPARAILGTANYVYVRTTRRSNTVNHPSCLVHSGWPHLATDPDRRRPRGRGSQRPQRKINMTRDMIGCSFAGQARDSRQLASHHRDPVVDDEDGSNFNRHVCGQYGMYCPYSTYGT
jgi:hypothetical protein